MDSIKVVIDGKETVLTYDSYSGARGYQYLTPDKGRSHAFARRLNELRGTEFKTNGHAYKVL